MMIPCSAITGEGIDDLLDAILLQTEMMELRYSPSRRPVAAVLEAHKDAKQGVLTTMLLMTGTLKVGDVIELTCESDPKMNTYYEIISLGSADEPWTLTKYTSA